MALSDLEAQEILIADALRYAARYRRDSLTLGTYKTPHRSRDNIGATESRSYKLANRARTAYSNPSLAEGTSPSMIVTLSDGSEHTVPASRNWRDHIKTTESTVTTPETARRGGSQAEYD